MFTELTPAVLSAPTSGTLLAILCFAISFYCIYSIEETFGKDLDYLEMKLVSNQQEPSAEKRTLTNRDA
jgi:hypothetical protein